MLMIDVDFFKTFNDRYGHPAGDEALKIVASVISQACYRPGDAPARIGGEEFALILANTSVAGAMAIAEKIRDTLFARNIEHLESPLGRLSVSIGVSVINPERNDDAAELVAEADRLLYVAKNSGRNCCCQANSLPKNAPAPTVEIVGEAINVNKNQVMESLVLSFSPSLFTLQQRWKNNGLSADFLADYVATFYPGPEDQVDFKERKAEFRGAISYIANEVLENAMKHSLNTLPYPITIRLVLNEGQIIFICSNTTSHEAAKKLKDFVTKLTEGDPAEMYIQILENSVDTGESGLGLVTMINDYNANLSWEFENVSEDICSVATKIKIVL